MSTVAAVIKQALNDAEQAVLQAQQAEAKVVELVDEQPSLFVGLGHPEITPAPAKNSTIAYPPLLPCIFVPGLTGSALNEVTNRETKRVWIGHLGDDPLVTLGVTWNGTDVISNNNIEVVPGLEGAEWLGTLRRYPYLHNLFEYVDKNFSDAAHAFSAAPYDWRLVPDPIYMNQWGKDLQSQVEVLYNTIGQKKVSLAGHSLGNLMVLYFLNKYVTADWKQQYIASYIAIAPPFGGAPHSVMAELSGDELYGHIPISKIYLNSLPSVLWLFPQPTVFTSTVVKVGSTSYSASSADIINLLQGDGLNTTAAIFAKLVLGVGNEILTTHPNVQTYIVTSVYKDATAVSFDYDSLPINGKPTNTNFETGTHGDGTVPYVSLHSNDIWLKTHANLTSQKEFIGPSHSGIIDHTDFHLYFGGLLSPI